MGFVRVHEAEDAGQPRWWRIKRLFGRRRWRGGDRMVGRARRKNRFRTENSIKTVVRVLPTFGRSQGGCDGSTRRVRRDADRTNQFIALPPPPPPPPSVRSIGECAIGEPCFRCRPRGRLVRPPPQNTPSERPRVRRHITHVRGVAATLLRMVRDRFRVSTIASLNGVTTTDSTGSGDRSLEHRGGSRKGRKETFFFFFS